MPKTTPPKWTLKPDQAKNVGRGLSAVEIRALSNNFTCEIKASESTLVDSFNTEHGIRKGEFFGINTITQVLKLANEVLEKRGSGECVGLRFYYGLAYEEINVARGTSKISSVPINSQVLRPRLLFTAVDQHGNDIDIDYSQLKDQPSSAGAGDGCPHPPYGN